MAVPETIAVHSGAAAPQDRLGRVLRGLEEAGSPLRVRLLTLVLVWILAYAIFLTAANFAVVPFTKAMNGEGLSIAESYMIPVCHRMPSRSFWIAAVPLGLCARCTGIYIGLAITLFALLFPRRRMPQISFPAALIAIGLAIADGTLQHYGMYDSGSAARALSGFSYGGGLAGLLFIMLRREHASHTPLIKHGGIRMHSRLFQRSKTVTAVLFAAFLFYAVTAPLQAYDKGETELRAGTVVALSLEETITSDMPVGSNVSFRVIFDVKVDDKVVIRAGAVAMGTISRVDETSAIGQPGEVTIDLRSVQAVDGQQVMLRGNINKEGDDKVVLSVILALLCLPLILIHGGDAKVPAGTEIRGYVEQDYKIKV